MALVVAVDDDPGTLTLLEALIEAQGHTFHGFATGAAFEAAGVALGPDVVFLDLKLPDRSGMELLAVAKERLAGVPVVMLTGERGVEAVVEAMRLGAFDYLAKPIDRTAVDKAVRNAVEQQRLRRRVLDLERSAARGGYQGMVGTSPAMERVFETLDRLAETDVTVLVRGESGTGKELVARAIHRMSRRSGGPFEAINCGALPETLHDAELFGHEKGAFTGASTRRPGRFELSDGGTLFLDELGDLAEGTQASLLRVLQERAFRRLGGTRDLSSDFRLVAATHRDLEERIGAGGFREDLYFRIAVFEIRLPPLRERSEDIPLLVHHFLAAEGRHDLGVSTKAMDALFQYDWPGNVRELEHAIRRACVTAPDLIRFRDLPARVRSGTLMAPSAPGEPVTRELRLEAVEERTIRTALRVTEGNITAAAIRLGIGRATLYRKMERYGLR